MSLPQPNVFVGNISQRTLPADVERLFARYGRVLTCKIKSDGYGFVEFEDLRDAEDAIRALDGYSVDGSKIRVEAGRGKPPGPGPGGPVGPPAVGLRPPGPRGPGPTGQNQVIVEDLDDHTSWQDLKDFARRAGYPVFTDVKRDGDRKIGIIEYRTSDDVRNACRTLDGEALHHRRVRVVEGRGHGGDRGGYSGGSSGGDYERNRGRYDDRYDRGPPPRDDRGYDRGPPPPRMDDRGGYSDRGHDRGPDRGFPMYPDRDDRGYGRGQEPRMAPSRMDERDRYDRGPPPRMDHDPRGYDRGGPPRDDRSYDRGYDRGLDRGYDRGPPLRPRSRSPIRSRDGYPPMRRDDFPPPRRY